MLATASNILCTPTPTQTTPPPRHLCVVATVVGAPARAPQPRARRVKAIGLLFVISARAAGAVGQVLVLALLQL
jgi:hypothetical protein